MDTEYPKRDKIESGRQKYNLRGQDRAKGTEAEGC